MAHQYRGIVALVAAVCLSTMIGSCGDAGQSDSRTAVEQRTLDSIADAMTDLEPWAMKACERQMSAAPDSLTYYDYLQVKARHYVFTDTPESTLVYTKKTARFLDRQPSTLRVNGMKAMNVAAEASFYYLMKDDAKRVVKLNAQAYSLARNSDISDRLPNLAANLADAYVADNDLSNASKWYRRALFLVDSLKLPKEENITLYMGLAQIYTQTRDFQLAKKYYELTDKQFDHMKPNMQTYFLNNYGNYLYFIHDYKAAYNMFMRMMRHLERQNAFETFDMHLCKINLADVMLNLGKADSAKVLANEVEPYFRKNRVMPALYYLNTIRLGIAIHESDPAAAMRIINSGDDTIAVENPMKRIRNKYLKDYYLSRGDYKNAYKHLGAEKEMNDSLLAIQSGNKSSAIISQLAEDTLKLHHKLEMEEKNVEIVQSRVWVIFLLALTISLVCATGYVIMRTRKRQLQMRVNLMELRLANARQRISPHFIFNLLNADMTKVSAEEQKKLLEISRLVRSSLALVHEPYVPLVDELEFVNRYVALYSTLLSDDFTFKCSPTDDNELQGVMIPPMMVQILVENAIKHGVKNKEGEKLISLQVTTNAESTTIIVTDNGPGMDICRHRYQTQHSGLYIIRHTINYINQYNRGSKRMTFNISNIELADGSIAGCRASIGLPKGLRYPEMKNDK